MPSSYCYYSFQNVYILTLFEKDFPLPAALQNYLELAGFKSLPFAAGDANVMEREIHRYCPIRDYNYVGDRVFPTCVHLNECGLRSLIW